MELQSAGWKCTGLCHVGQNLTNADSLSNTSAQRVIKQESELISGVNKTRVVIKLSRMTDK
jgi:hypothetical protein